MGNDRAEIKTTQSFGSFLDMELFRFLVIGFGLVAVGFLPILPVILEFNESTNITTSEPWQCNNSCEFSLRINSSAISTFEKFSLDSSRLSALFVNFSAYNLSLKPSNHILDPLNLVWVESIDAPFLSLDLGFIVYSFGMLSRKVHHMTVIIEEDARRCLWNMNYTCATETLSTAYLQHVSKGRGVLCYTVKDTQKSINSVIYQCCKENLQSRQIECGIPAQNNSYMATIFTLVVVLAAIALLCFPVIWVNIPDEDAAETLSRNTQIRINPAYQLLKAVLGCLPRKWARLFKIILNGLFFPILYYIYLYERWNTKEYQIPTMFNNAVKETWPYIGLLLPLPFFVVAVVYHIGVLFYIIHSFEPNLAEKDFKICWKIPFEKTFNFVRNTWCEESGLSKWILCFLKLLISPIVCCLYLIGYTCYISPTARVIDFMMTQFVPFFKALKECGSSFCVFLIMLLLIHLCSYFFLFAIGIIIWSSLLLISRHIVYVLMGLVANNDYLPLFTLIFVFGYYVWDCFKSKSQEYQKLLIQTFEECSKRQKGQDEPATLQTLQFDDEGVPKISTKLFQKVIDKILPLSDVYTKILVKITIILLFLLLTYYSILVFGKSSLNDYTRAIAVFLGGIIPKLVEIFRDNSSELLDIENSYKIETIVKDFINSNENSGNGSLNGDHTVMEETTPLLPQI